MLFVITSVIFLAWAVYIIHKGRLSPRVVFGIYSVIVLVAEFGDLTCDYWLDLYDLPTHLFHDSEAGYTIGILLSDTVVFPCVAIIFCYYAARYHRPWLLSFAFAAMLGIIEFIYVKLDFMTYHYWAHWTTALIAFVSFRVLAIYAARFITLVPPISYRFRLLCALCTFAGVPGALLSGGFRLFIYTPILAKETTNDPFIVLFLTAVLGAAAALLIPITAQQYKMIVLVVLGGISAFVGLWLHSVGLMHYIHWNNYLTVILHLTPYPALYFYDSWECGKYYIKNR